MLNYYATLRQFMRIPMGVLMRGANSIKKISECFPVAGHP